MLKKRYKVPRTYVTVAPITTGSALIAALDAATGGETFYVQGTFTDLYITTTKVYTSPVTVIGLNATFDTLRLTNKTNLHFSNISFHHASNYTYDHESIVYISACANVGFYGCQFSTGGSFPWLGRGLTIDGDSSNIKFEDCTFTYLTRGIVVYAVNGLDVQKCKFAQVREGIDLIGVENVLVYRTLFTDFQVTETDHSDAIQIFQDGSDRDNANHTYSENLIIGNNVTATNGVQSIFLETQDKGTGFRARNVQILRNFIVANLAAGIAGGAEHGGELIEGNTVVRPTTYKDSPGLEATTSGYGTATVRNNISDRYNLGVGVVESGNITLDFSGGSTDYANVFAGPTRSNTLASSWLAKPGSAADSDVVGANATLVWHIAHWGLS